MSTTIGSTLLAALHQYYRIQIFCKSPPLISIRTCMAFTSWISFFCPPKITACLDDIPPAGTRGWIRKSGSSVYSRVYSRSHDIAVPKLGTIKGALSHSNRLDRVVFIPTFKTLRCSIYVAPQEFSLLVF